MKLPWPYNDITLNTFVSRIEGEVLVSRGMDGRKNN